MTINWCKISYSAIRVHITTTDFHIIEKARGSRNHKYDYTNASVMCHIQFLYGIIRVFILALGLSGFRNSTHWKLC